MAGGSDRSLSILFEGLDDEDEASSTLISKLKSWAPKPKIRHGISSGNYIPTWTKGSRAGMLNLLERETTRGDVGEGYDSLQALLRVMRSCTNVCIDENKFQEVKKFVDDGLLDTLLPGLLVKDFPTECFGDILLIVAHISKIPDCCDAVSDHVPKIMELLHKQTCRIQCRKKIAELMIEIQHNFSEIHGEDLPFSSEEEKHEHMEGLCKAILITGDLLLQLDVLELLILSLSKNRSSLDHVWPNQTVSKYFHDIQGENFDTAAIEFLYQLNSTQEDPKVNLVTITSVRMDGSSTLAQPSDMISIPWFMALNLASKSITFPSEASDDTFEWIDIRENHTKTVSLSGTGRKIDIEFEEGADFENDMRLPQKAKTLTIELKSNVPLQSLRRVFGNVRVLRKVTTQISTPIAAPLSVNGTATPKVNPSFRDSPRYTPLQLVATSPQVTAKSDRNRTKAQHPEVTKIAREENLDEAEVANLEWSQPARLPFTEQRTATNENSIQLKESKKSGEEMVRMTSAKVDTATAHVTSAVLQKENSLSSEDDFKMSPPQRTSPERVNKRNLKPPNKTGMMTNNSRKKSTESKRPQSRPVIDTVSKVQKRPSRVTKNTKRGTNAPPTPPKTASSKKAGKQVRPRNSPHTSVSEASVSPDRTAHRASKPLSVSQKTARPRKRDQEEPIDTDSSNEVEFYSFKPIGSTVQTASATTATKTRKKHAAPSGSSGKALKKARTNTRASKIPNVSPPASSVDNASDVDAPDTNVEVADEDDFLRHFLSQKKTSKRHASLSRSIKETFSAAQAQIMFAATTLLEHHQGEREQLQNAFDIRRSKSFQKCTNATAPLMSILQSMKEDKACLDATYAKLVQVEHQVKEQRSLSDEHFDATNLSCSEDKEDASKKSNSLKAKIKSCMSVLETDADSVRKEKQMNMFRLMANFM